MLGQKYQKRMEKAAALVMAETMMTTAITEAVTAEMVEMEMVAAEELEEKNKKVILGYLLIPQQTRSRFLRLELVHFSN
jgi:hypothetical protein